jgi:carbon storage regulator
LLVLGRKPNEAVVVNGNITIFVVRIRKNQVSLGIEAPKEVPVHRREVHDAIQRKQNR